MNIPPIQYSSTPHPFATNTGSVDDLGHKLKYAKFSGKLGYETALE